MNYIPYDSKKGENCLGCRPWDPEYWNDVKVPQGMDPALYNVINGCWLCNFYIQNNENEYLLRRSFFNGVQGPPCNKPNFFVPPMNSKDMPIKF